MSNALNGVTPKGKEKTKSFADIFPSHSQKTLAELESLNKKLHLTIDADEIDDLCAVSETNFLFGGLNLIYAPDSYGKSWQLCIAVKNSCVNNFYLDTDGSNGKAFVEHCHNNNVYYVKADSIDVIPGKDLFEKTIKTIDKIGNTMKELKNVIIIDSLTSLMEGAGINNAEDISDPLYNLNRLAAKYNAALILIDHATEGDTYEDKFKLEGNAGAKRRTTVTVHRYIPTDKKKPEKGGTFICERARGNTSNISIGSRHIVQSTTVEDALNFMLLKFPKLKKNGITQSDATYQTRHNNNQWVRDYFDLIFDSTKKSRTTILTLKKKYITKDEC